MREQFLTLGCFGSVLSGVENQIAAGSVRESVDGARGLRRRWIRMHFDPAKIAIETRLEERSGSVVEGMTRRVHYIVNCRWRCRETSTLRCRSSYRRLLILLAISTRAAAITLAPHYVVGDTISFALHRIVSRPNAQLALNRKFREGERRRNRYICGVEVFGCKLRRT